MSNPLVVSLAALAVVSGSLLAVPQVSSAQTTGPAALASINDPDVTPPRPTHTPEPKYPHDARAAGRQGTSVLSLIVGTDGRPRDINLVRALDAELDESAIAKVRTWRYKPARRGDKPVEVRIEARLRFRLNNRDHKKIAELWDRSDESDPKADWELSKIYFEGRGVPQNDQLGLWFLKRAADWNLPEAQFLMGEHFYKTQNVPPDYVRAYMWYALSKRSGSSQGEQMLKILAPKMSTEQLTEAETRVGYWPENPPKEVLSQITAH